MCTNGPQTIEKATSHSMAAVQKGHVSKTQALPILLSDDTLQFTKERSVLYIIEQ